MAALTRRDVAPAVVVTALGAVACTVGLFLEPVRTLHAWLAVWVFATSTAVGALLFLLIGHVVDGTWMVVLRRLNHAVVSVFPALLVAFVPVVVGVDSIYPWVDPQAADEPLRALLEHKRAWLNVPGFNARTACYFAVFIFIAELFRRWELARDADDGRAPIDHARERIAAAIALPPVSLALTFGAFDWTMSLEPAWSSTAYGVYYFAGGFLAALALITVLAWLVVHDGRAADAITKNHFHALGRMMLAFTVLWAYIAFFQIMLIKIANKPDEAPFYLARSIHGWQRVSWMLIVGHFAVPFLYLLPRGPKLHGGAMAFIAGWLLVVHAVDCYWLVLPVLPGGPIPHWVDLAAAVTLLGGLVAFAMWRRAGVALLPFRDPTFEASKHYRSAA